MDCFHTVFLSPLMFMLMVVMISCLSPMPTTMPTTSTQLLLSSSSSDVHIFDNVMPPDSRAAVHQVATKTGLTHTLMDRRNKPLLSQPLEVALAGILQQLNDTSPYVEYWCRQEWRHIEAHADVDEYRAKMKKDDGDDDNDFRYPTNGHVLYLQIGSKVQGPTCLFPNCTNGGDLLVLQNEHDVAALLPMIAVPAVAGRLLRFPGHWLHAVPRPTDIWMLPFVQGSPDFSDDDYQRSVVLFNTWNEEPPMSVPELLEKSADTDDAAATCTDDDDDDDTKRLVDPFIDWDSQDVQSDSQSSPRYKKTKIWLLGDLRRRNHVMRTVSLYSCEENLRRALEESNQPRCTWFSQQPSISD